MLERNPSIDPNGAPSTLIDPAAAPTDTFNEADPNLSAPAPDTVKIPFADTAPKLIVFGGS